MYPQGKPLLSQGGGPGLHQPSWFDFPTALRLSPGLAGSSAALGVSGEGVPRYLHLLKYTPVHLLLNLHLNLQSAPTSAGLQWSWEETLNLEK